MKRIKFSCGIFAASLLLCGASISPAQANGFKNENSKKVSEVTIAAGAPSNQPVDSLAVSPSSENDLPKLNPTNLSISTGRDVQGNLLVTDTGTIKFVEQSAGKAKNQDALASAGTAATTPPAKPVDGIGFNPKVKFSLFAIDTTSINTFFGSSAAPTLNQKYSQLYNQYTIVPNISISFFGKDQLLVSGILTNYQFDTPGCGTPSPGTAHFYCFPTQNTLQLFRAWYSFYVNDNIKVTVGPRLYSYDLLPVSTASYSPKGANFIGLRSLLFDIVDYASVPGTYPLTLGPGAGITYAKDGWALGGGIIAGNPQTGDTTGMLDNNNGSTAVVQLSYSGARGGFQAAWTNTAYPLGGYYFQEGSTAAWNPFNWSTSMTVNTAAIGGYYYIIPQKFSISGGMNYGFYAATSDGYLVKNGDSAVSNTWLITLQYEKLFNDKVAIGTSFGQLGMIKSNTSQGGAIDNQATPPWILMTFLNWQVAKHLSLSPYLYWSTSDTKVGSSASPSEQTGTFGAALMATLAFY
jgi:hypothetical protein